MINEFLEALEDDDDVQNIYTNVKMKKHNMIIVGIDPGLFSGAISILERWKNLQMIVRNANYDRRNKN